MSAVTINRNPNVPPAHLPKDQTKAHPAALPPGMRRGRAVWNPGSSWRAQPQAVHGGVASTCPRPQRRPVLPSVAMDWDRGWPGSREDLGEPGAGATCSWSLPGGQPPSGSHQGTPCCPGLWVRARPPAQDSDPLPGTPGVTGGGGDRNPAVSDPPPLPRTAPASPG